jgi:hypothetical protein
MKKDYIHIKEENRKRILVIKYQDKEDNYRLVNNIKDLIKIKNEVEKWKRK